MTDLQEEGTLVLCLRTGGPEPLREVLGFGSGHEVSQSQRLLLQLFWGFPGEETFTLALQHREKAALRVLSPGTATSFANYCPVTNEPSFSQSGISKLSRPCLIPLQLGSPGLGFRSTVEQFPSSINVNRLKQKGKDSSAQKAAQLQIPPCQSLPVGLDRNPRQGKSLEQVALGVRHTGPVPSHQLLP